MRRRFRKLRRGRPQALPSTKPKKPKSQVRKNRDAGLAFENEIFHYLTEYLSKRNIRGIVYRLPSKMHYDQPIDILLDSAEFGYIGVECKSIKDASLPNGKIRLKTLSRVHSEYGHQFKKEHEFLKAGGRYGIVAFKFTSMKVTIFIPHQYIYDKIEEGFTHVHIDELLDIGFYVEDDKASLKLYLQKYCRTT